MTNTIASDRLVEAIARAMEPHVNDEMGEPFKSAWLADLAQAALTAITEAGCTIVSKDGLHELLRAANDAREALDNGTRYERGAGGMTIDAQIARTVINNVPACVVEPLHLAIVNLDGATNNGKAE